MNGRQRGYIVPTDWLSANAPLDGWHAVLIDQVPSQSLLFVEWIHGAQERDFEADVNVTPLGDPWETPSTEVLLLLSSASSTIEQTASSTSTATPVTDPPVVTETLANALRKLDWPFARALF